MKTRVPKRRIIWTAFPDFDDWKDFLIEEYPDESEEQLWEIMMDMNGFYLGDERVNLDIKLDNNIIVIANLGLWNGRHVGYKELGNNVKECLSSEYDPEWYVDPLGDLRCDDYHHDGCNHYLYRVWKNVSDTQRENFLEKLLYGNITRRDINRYTRRISEIGKVYGWN